MQNNCYVSPFSFCDMLEQVAPWLGSVKSTQFLWKNVFQLSPTLLVLD